MPNHVELPYWLYDRVLQCLARAELEGTFKDCVVPDIGNRTILALLQYDMRDKG